jgi:nitrate reductase NapE component
MSALAAFYAAGVVVATVGGWVAARKLGDQDQPAERLLLWSVIAGVLWPVLLVGIVQMIGVWMLAKAVARPRSARSVGGEGWPKPVKRIHCVIVMPSAFGQGTPAGRPSYSTRPT